MSKRKSQFLSKGFRAVLSTRDFSEVEDSPFALEIIRQLGAKAGKSAMAEARAMGLPITFARGNEIVRVFPDGKEEIVPAPLPACGTFYIRYKPGTVFRRRRKR